MRRYLAFLLLFVFVSGCSTFDPLSLWPHSANNPDVKPDTGSDKWETRSPDRQVYADIKAAWLAEPDLAAAKQASKDYAGLFLALAAEVTGNPKIIKTKQVFYLLKASGSSLNIVPGSHPTFSSLAAKAITDKVSDSDKDISADKTPLTDALQSIGCGCAGAFEQINKKK